MSFRNSLNKLALNGFLIAISFLALYPLLIMFFGSFKTAEELSADPGGIPHFITLENYFRLGTNNSGIMIRTFFNSIYIAITHSFLVIFVSSLAAFAFAKYKFKGRDLIFACLIAMIMVPTELTIPPLFIMFSKIGWLNTYTVQIIPGIASVFAMFLMRQYMFSIPNELLDSAKIDGARHFRIYLSVIVPVSAPIIGALTILTFLSKWNDFLWPIVMVNKAEKMPIMVILPLLNDTSQMRSIPWELILTGCVLVTIPLVIVFLKYQDKFMSSAIIGAVKE